MCHNLYIKRCIELAKKGIPNAFPNPLVGAVLVYSNKIIAEGYHEKYGSPHAEINCINQLKDKSLLKKSTLYISLEPCSHFGKTPPCANAIIDAGIKKVVVGCRDFSKKVNGKGIELLKNNNIEVIENVIEEECIKLNEKFFAIQKNNFPYIILKWAQSKDNFIGNENEKTILSNFLSQQLNHKWRSEEMGILIGYKTALIDNPQLNCRLIKGKHPTRIIIDDNLQLPKQLNIFDGTQKTIIFNKIKNDAEGNIIFLKYNDEISILKQLYEYQIFSLIIEGGAKTIQKFISKNLWNESRIINTSIELKNGISAPTLNPSFYLENKFFLKNDTIFIYKNKSNS